MGASGCGKSTVGSGLAERLGVPFVDGDGLHPQQNVEKMARGIPLTGEDRHPWLVEVGATPRRHEATGLVIACSALRVIYRNIIRTEAPNAYFVHLQASRAVLAGRLLMRADHFMPLSLLDDQLQPLGPLRVHESGVSIDADQKIDRIVRAAVSSFDRRPQFT